MRIHSTLMIAALFSGIAASAQTCSCCSAGSGNMAVNFLDNDTRGLKKHSLQGEIQLEQREFKPLENTEIFYEVKRYGATVDAGRVSLFTGRLTYGLSERFSLSVVAPYLLVRSSVYSGSSKQDVREKGLADARLMGTYKVFNSCTRNVTIFLTGGVELPLGKKSVDNAVVLGSGSYDPLAGIYISKKYKAFDFRGGILCKLSTTGYQDINFGNVCNYALSALYSCKKRESDSLRTFPHPGKRPGVQLMLNCSGEKSYPQYKANIAVQNTGSFKMFAGAGAIFIFRKKYVIPLSVDMPIYQTVSGTQNRSSLRIKTGIIYSFH
jgi:hypothetical protein